MHLLNDNIVTAGDGSVSNGKASHAWCIARKNDYSVTLEGVGPTDGHPDSMTSVRPETISCIAIGSLLHMICSAANISSGYVPFYTDSDTVVTNSNQKHWQSTKHVLMDNIDVIIKNNLILRKLKLDFVPVHVKGHQDRVHPYHQLSREAKLNVRMDALASEFLADPPTHLTPQPAPIFFPSQQIGIKIKGELFSCDVVSELIYSNRSNDITDYFERHFDIPPTEFDTIDWTCLNYTLRKHSKKRQLIKGLHHQWDTLGRNLRWNRIQNGECLLCGNNIEDWRHVLRCSNEHMIRKRNELVEQLKKC